MKLAEYVLTIAAESVVNECLRYNDSVRFGIAPMWVTSWLGARYRTPPVSPNMGSVNTPFVLVSGVGAGVAPTRAPLPLLFIRLAAAASMESVVAAEAEGLLRVGWVGRGVRFLDGPREDLNGTLASTSAVGRLVRSTDLSRLGGRL
jgi:hypothetical protein